MKAIACLVSIGSAICVPLWGAVFQMSFHDSYNAAHVGSWRRGILLGFGTELLSVTMEIYRRTLIVKHSSDWEMQSDLTEVQQGRNSAIYRTILNRHQTTPLKCIRHWLFSKDITETCSLKSLTSITKHIFINDWCRRAIHEPPFTFIHLVDAFIHSQMSMFL